MLEGYLDFCLAVFANLEEPHFNTYSDIINMVLTYFLIFLIVLFPLLALVFLSGNREKFEQIKFTQKFGALYDGLKVGSENEKIATSYMAPWFTFRRLAFSIFILQLRN